MIFGIHYRDVWAMPVEVRVINLRMEKGGLRPLRKGGSNQTINLRLTDSTGHQYVLRSVDKDPSKALKDNFLHPLLKDIMRDQTSSALPYGALIAAELAEGSGIYHTNPEYVFVPYDCLTLGEYCEDFSGAMVLFEERPDDAWPELESFGFAEDIKGSENTFRRIASSQSTRVDQEAFLKARLLDMLIGDWSRREDQWRWAWFDNDSITVLKPIPRDRDHAFFRFRDGLIPILAGLAKPQYRPFKRKIGNVKHLNHAARRLDYVMLNSLTRENWLTIIQEFYEELTPYEIIEAVDELPLETEPLIAGSITEKLLSRRADLLKAGLKYYEILAHKVTVQGTDHDEIFTLKSAGNGRLMLEVTGENGEVIYSRTFSDKETRELHILGLDGDDRFLDSSGAGRIKIYLYGGKGNDYYEALSSSDIVIYDDRVSGTVDAKVIPRHAIHTAEMRDWINNFYFD